MKKIGLLAALTMASFVAMADCRLPAYNATYSLSSSNRYLGQVRDRLSMADNKFRFVSDVNINVKVLFMHYRDIITATSVGVMNKNVFQSQHFIFAEQRKNQHIHRLVKTGEFDSQSIVLSAVSQMAAGQTPAASESVWFNKKLQRVGIKVNAKPVTIKTALGKMKTREVTMRFSDGTQARYWLAPKLHYVVVKNVTTDPKGKSIYRMISKYTANAKQCLLS